MKSMVFRFLASMFLSGLSVAGAQVPAGADWHLEKDKEGIKVYTAPVGSSGRKYIKVSADMTGSLRGVEEVFRDIGRQKAWVYGTRTAYLVQKISDELLLYYNETNLPWPVSNRDVVIRMKLVKDPGNHSLSITQAAEPSVVPINKGIVRVSHLMGYWTFHEVNTGKLYADYYLDVDPAGSLPSWAVNLFIAKGPYETFLKLREQLKNQPQ